MRQSINLSTLNRVIEFLKVQKIGKTQTQIRDTLHIDYYSVQYCLEHLKKGKEVSVKNDKWKWRENK